MPRGIHTGLASASGQVNSSEDHINSAPSIDTSSCDRRKRSQEFDPEEILVVSMVGKDIILPSNQCADKMRHLFLQMYDAEGVDWQRVTAVTKDFYWRDFKNSIVHPGFDEKQIYKAWEKKARVRYADWMCELRTNNKTCPEGIVPSIWNNWARYWKTDEFKKKSVRGRNARTRNGKGMVNHTGGSQTFAVHLERMERTLQKKVDPAEFHKNMHMYKKKPGVYCDKKAKETHDIYEREMDKKLKDLQLQAEFLGSPIPSELSLEEKAQTYKEVVGGIKKGGKVYGVGSAVSQIYPSESSSTKGASTEKVVELEQKLENCNLELAREKEERKKEMAELKEQQRKEIDNMKKWFFANMNKVMGDYEDNETDTE